MYGPGTGISVIAFPTGIAPFVAGSGGGAAAGVVRDAEGVADAVRPAFGVAGESGTGESPDIPMGTCRAHAVSAVPVTAPVAKAKNPRRFIAVPPPCSG